MYKKTFKGPTYKVQMITPPHQLLSLGEMYFLRGIVQVIDCSTVGDVTLIKITFN
ncbi:hypothetical protein Hanom_Chr12g01136501 [Helianthus anomalus]